jgi:hypothetical protein
MDRVNLRTPSAPGRRSQPKGVTQLGPIALRAIRVPWRLAFCPEQLAKNAVVEAWIGRHQLVDLKVPLSVLEEQQEGILATSNVDEFNVVLSVQ